MTDPTNQGEKTRPNVVPASFTPPAPEQFEKPVSQNLRTKQSQMGQGFALRQISFYENQLHAAQYRRVNPDQTDAELEILVKDSKTARTVMMNNIQEWAGNLSEEELEGALPTVWSYYMQQVQAEHSPAPETPGVSEEAEEAPDPREADPIQVINRPHIPEDAPRSRLLEEAGAEVDLRDILEDKDDS